MMKNVLYHYVCKYRVFANPVANTKCDILVGFPKSDHTYIAFRWAEIDNLMVPVNNTLRIFLGQ